MKNYVTLRPGVTLRLGSGGKASIRFQAMINGERVSKTCELDPEIAVKGWKAGTRSLRPTPILEAEYLSWYNEMQQELGGDENEGQKKVPTIGEMMAAYDQIVERRWKRIGKEKPSLKSVRSAQLGTRNVMVAAGLSENDSVRKLMHRRTLRGVLDRLQARGVAGDTVKTYLAALQRLTAKWTDEYYEDMGIKVVRPEMPDLGGTAKSRRYVRLGQELKDKIDMWYTGLQEERNQRLFAFATMVYQFAMRPNDVIRLTGENFVMKDGAMWLVYTPHKTEGSSGRVVRWKFAPAIQELMLKYKPNMCEKGEVFIPAGRYVHDELNYLLRRECGLSPEEWGKGVYELRKLCIDTVYHEMGPKYAVALSGDRRETVEYYYADPYAVTDDVPTIVVGRIRA